MLAMNKDIKKILVCGASLMMIASLGVGTNNVSAHRVHHHNRRTSLVSRQRRSVYQSNTRKRLAQFNAVQSYVNWVAKYDKNHAKKLNSYKLRHLNRYMTYLTFSQKRALFNQLNKVQKHSHRVAKYHARRAVRKYRKVRHATRKHAKVRRVLKRRGHVSTARFDVTTPVIKRVSKVHKNVVPRKSVAQPTVNKAVAPKAQPTQPSAKPVQKSAPDETDGGKYYSWNQLQDVLGTPAIVDGWESQATDKKIYDTLNFNLGKWNYSDEQLSHLQNNPYIQQKDPYLMATANAEESINKLP